MATMLHHQYSPTASLQFWPRKRPADELNEELFASHIDHKRVLLSGFDRTYPRFGQAPDSGVPTMSNPPVASERPCQLQQIANAVIGVVPSHCHEVGVHPLHVGGVG